LEIYDNLRAVSRAVAVSGIGIVSPFGSTQQSFIDDLLQGRSAIAPLVGFETSNCVTTLAAQTTSFQPTDWVTPMRLRRLERTATYAVAVARLAFEDAGRQPVPDGDDDAGVVLGTWTAGGQQSETYLDAFFKGGPQMAPALLFESTVGNAPASVAALEHKLRGPNVTISQMEASGIVAIASAVEMLRLGRAKQVLSGGVDVIFETFFRAWDLFNVMSPATERSRALAPFDRERNGASGFFSRRVLSRSRSPWCVVANPALCELHRGLQVRWFRDRRRTDKGVCSTAPYDGEKCLLAQGRRCFSS
jgi:3-oxoacyl-[acyl-carrier-protein] synthase II